MNVNLEALEQIPQLVALTKELIKLQKEGTIEKRWLNVEEVAFYLGYSKDKVYKLVQEDWIQGKHYTKPSGRLIFNKYKIDEWVEGKEELGNTNKIIDDIFCDIKLTS